MEYSYMTQEGFDQLMAEISRLEKEERPAIAQQIAEARDKGDLSENAEYDAAREAQGMLEAKISQLKTKAANARIIDESMIDSSKVQILTKVRVRNLDDNTEVTYAIVPEADANFKEKKLSITAPIARGLMGKRVGEIAEIQIPIGLLRLEILEITL
ncbi:transcription elongation factor GreA [Porphyromonas circumdentaria]|uniref:Transcription elongation factor GreA n=1 Tax=Porphyromonas circumdentaria TaxID=29524 RepID=A0A1T4NMR6_9PORP|nr:transcription elongation factor GreA [Porphyromonas circumdentaria]MBB6276130.1 transcription elongation factor GreA [Porphyromonas circumdentaria]MDO4723085.1 transcription elongation factor GreA [Porphyromonas circumdentaria]SJZ80502.1 transcription elongation factor GreA [Porphyromonas circumdentaria]